MSDVRLVVIDDSPIVRDAICLALEPLGWHVTPLDNAFGVTNKIIAARAQVILVDLNMPLLTGEGLMKTLLRIRHRLGDALLVLHSDRSEDELRATAAETGADGWIRKTSDAAALDRRLRLLLQGGGDRHSTALRSAPLHVHD